MRFGAAAGQHGDLGAEVVAAAADGRLLVFGVRAHVSLQVPPPPLPLDLPLDLREIQTATQKPLQNNQLKLMTKKQHKTRDVS